MLRAGIVGLPNVGKSTLFNAVTRTRKAEAANYPFCTIDPNVGIVTVPDARLAVLQKIAKTNVVIPAAIEFVDIAGLVKGASQGEGLGNKFLTHIREVDAIVQVVRCFEDEDIHHVSGIGRSGARHRGHQHRADARRPRVGEEAARARRQGHQDAATRRRRREDAVLAKIETALDAGKPALTVALTPEEKAIAREFFLLSDKPTIFACNVKDTDLAGADANPYVAQGPRLREDAPRLRGGRHQRADRERAGRSRARTKRTRSSRISASPESGMGALIRATYHLLGLRTYFTAGEKEVRAWTIHAGDTAPKAAGVIHSDFERGFIKAETVAYDDLVALRLDGRGAREGPLPDGRQGIRRRRRRRPALQVQRLISPRAEPRLRSRETAPELSPRKYAAS